MDKWAF